MSAKTYLEKIHKELQYFATWFPQNIMRLGDVGTMKKKQFIYKATLSELGIPFRIDEGDSRKADAFTYYSTDGIEVSFNGSADGSETLTEGKASVNIRLKKEKAIIFKPKGVQVFRIKNQISLGNKILELYKQGKWEKKWVVVTEIIKVESATILISESKKGVAEITSSLTLGNQSFDIADADLGLNFTNSQSLSTEILAQQELTPLFLVSGINFWGRSFNTRGIEKATPLLGKGGLQFGEIPFDELDWA